MEPDGRVRAEVGLLLYQGALPPSNSRTPKYEILDALKLHGFKCVEPYCAFDYA